MTRALLSSVLALTLGGCTQLEKAALQLGFGPPKTNPKELHDPEGTAADHSRFNAVLLRFVDDAGYVDYRGLREGPEELDAYIEELGRLSFASLSRDHKLATLINAYNAFTLRLIVDHYPVESIKDIPAKDRWDAKRWSVGSLVLSLNDIEHEKLRKEFVEPRIHFAVNCASVGCPPLARSAYTGERIEDELERAARRVHDPDERWLEFDRLLIGPLRVGITRLYLWYADDFPPVEVQVAKYIPEFEKGRKEGRRVTLEYLEYDWSLNDQAKKKL